MIRQARRPPRAPAAPVQRATSFPDFECAREHLARFGIDLQEGRVIVPCQKADWGSPVKSEVCQIEKSGGTYSALVFNLPYFFGPKWLEMSGGKPTALECESIEELVELLEFMLAKRMVDGVLPVP